MTKTVITCLIAASIVLGAIPAQATAQTAVWDAMSFTEVKDEFVSLVHQDPRADHGHLATYAMQRFPNAASVDGAEITEWLWLVHAVSPYASQATKDDFALEITNTLVPDAETLPQLNGERMSALTAALRVLGQKTQACSLAAAWVEGSDAFKSLPLVEVTPLCRVLAIDNSVGGAAKAKVLLYLDQEVLPNTALAGSLSVRGWARIAKSQQDSLTPAQKVRWADHLTDAFAGSQQAVAAMGPKDFTSLGDALGYLSKPYVREVGRLWVAQHPDFTWPEASRVQVTYLAVVLRQAKQDRAASHLGSNWIAANGDDQEQTFQAGELTVLECAETARAWISKRDSDKAQQWATRTLEKVLAEQNPTVADAALAAVIQDEAGLAGEGEGDFTEYASVLATLASQGKLKDAKRHEALSCPLNSPEARAIVEAEMVDPVGQPRVAVAKILGWSYRRAGQLKLWQGQLEQRIAAQQEDGDIKAVWMIARAHASALETDDEHPLGGKAWLDQALATAESEENRFQVLEILVNGYAKMGKHNAGVALLDSVTGQFSSQESSAELGVLRAQVEKDKVEFGLRRLEFKRNHNRRIKAASSKE